MAARAPRVSIGMPVLDGERYIADAIESLLAQDYTDFELIISDNASTDATPEICKSYVAADERVRYMRNPYNLGAAFNFNRLVAEARGVYFKWAPHDDLYAPAYLGRCVAVLDAHPDVVLCHSRSVEIDDGGAVLRRWDALPARADADPVRRFTGVLARPDQCVDAIGLIRRDVLARTARIGAYSSSDIGLLAELALHGRFHTVDEELFFRREHEHRSTRRYATDRERGVWFSPALAGVITYPLWRLARELVRGARRAPLQAVDRWRVYGRLLPWAWQWRDRLAREAGWGAREHLRRARRLGRRVIRDSTVTAR